MVRPCTTLTLRAAARVMFTDLQRSIGSSHWNIQPLTQRGSSHGGALAARGGNTRHLLGGVQRHRKLQPCCSAQRTCDATLLIS